jgi:outer membrane protein TolC
VGTAQDRSGRDIVEQIVRDGPQARAIREEVEVRRREQLARLTYPNPAVHYTREGAGFTELLQFEQSLPFLGVRSLLTRAGAEATAAAEADRDARLWGLRVDGQTAVARLVAEQNQHQAAEQYVKDVERLVDVLRTREREGEGSKFDRLRAEHELQEARQIVTVAAIAVSDARSRVLAMSPPETSLSRVVPDPAATRAPLDAAALVEQARMSRAELRALERARARTDLEGMAARKARLPSPTVFGGVKRANDGPGRATGGIVGLNLSLPLFDNGSRVSARWSAEALRIDAERAALDAVIRAEVSRSLEALALREAAAGQAGQADDSELLTIADVSYREGEVGILELLDAVRATARATARNIGIQLEVRLAQIALERAVGGVLWR